MPSQYRTALKISFAFRPWPRRVSHAVAVAVVIAEVLLGIGGLVLFFVPEVALTIRAVAYALCGGIYFAYASYTLALVLRGSRVTCGCSRADHPVTGWIVGRAAFLGFMAFVGLALSSESPSLPYLWSELLVLATACLSLGMLVWLFPFAMTLPNGGERS